MLLANRQLSPVKPQHSAEHGNVLFLIFIAVALFAALSYAITNSTRSGGESISQEKADLAATELAQYGVALRSAITRLLVVNGCTDRTISFWTDTNNDGAATIADTFFNPLSPTNFSCHVFHPQGGGVALQMAPESARQSDDYIYTGGHPVLDVPIPGPPITADLIYGLRDISRDVCLAANRALEISLVSGDAPTDPAPGSHLTTPFIGTYVTGPHIQSAQLRGKREGCFRRTAGSGEYVYYFVLIERF